MALSTSSGGLINTYHSQPSAASSTAPLTKVRRNNFRADEKIRVIIYVNLTMTDEWQQTGFCSWAFSSRPCLVTGVDRVSVRCLAGRGDMEAASMLLVRHNFVRLSKPWDEVPVYQALGRAPATTLINPGGAKSSMPYPDTIYIFFGEDSPGEEVRKNWLRLFDELMDSQPWGFAGFTKREFRHNDLLVLQDTGIGPVKRYEKALYILYSHGFRPCWSKYPFTPQFRAPVDLLKSTRAPVDVPKSIRAYGGAGLTKGRKIVFGTGKDPATFKLDGRVVTGPRLGGLEMGGTRLGDQLPEKAGPSIQPRHPPPQVAACVQVCGPAPPVVTQTSTTAKERSSLRGLRSARDSLLDFFW
ncbi:unnamed protein product [Clonostachys solani]|uniref:Uncharacterized protein n=1 Tax=Clonostachys solani TaxID=160281 RepID=A0A9N9W2G4_9HYPO|nr:unnamed protein product [Clonostachys solani]